MRCFLLRCACLGCWLCPAPIQTLPPFTAPFPMCWTTSRWTAHTPTISFTITTTLPCCCYSAGCMRLQGCLALNLRAMPLWGLPWCFRPLCWPARWCCCASWWHRRPGAAAGRWRRLRFCCARCACRFTFTPRCFTQTRSPCFFWWPRPGCFFAFRAAGGWPLPPPAGPWPGWAC